ncbi:helix-turn-helix transcriptional regulator [Actinocrispum wychmicini]|nr:YafY family protein [Actinocrispum wychmicini]
MNAPSTRMLTLLSLLQDGRAWPAAELAERLDTTPRTMRRDIDRLRELGYPVESSRGPGGGYQLVAGQAMPPLALTDDEAVATVVGLQFAATAQVEGTTGALRKIEQVLPSRLRHRVQAVAATVDTVSRSTLDANTLRTLSMAAYAHQDVRFRYTNRAGAGSERRVHPYRQVFMDGRWYLLGWDRDRQDWRTFRLDRIDELDVPGTTFTPVPLPPAVSFVQRPDDRRQGVVRFEAPLATVSERLVPQAGSLEAIDETTCRYVTAADSWEWLAITLAVVGVPYTIEGPPELREYSRRLAERLSQAILES